MGSLSLWTKEWQVLILFADSKNRHLRGEIKLAKLACSGCLAPCFVDSDCLTAAITYSPVHAPYEVPTWSRATLYCTDVWAPPRNWWRSCCITAVSVGSATRGESIMCLLLWPCASQGKISTSACGSCSLWCWACAQYAETLGRTRALALEQEPRGPERMSISDSEVVRGGDDEP